MNVALEYILRNGRAEQLLALPCSLFLENAVKKSKRKDVLSGKLIVTLTPRYGTNSVIVRHHQLSKVTVTDMLPSFEEQVIVFEKIFKHPSVIVPEYKLLEFQAQPYDSEEKQVNDLPLAAIQERQYKECLMTYFSPKLMNRVRENWLWTCFDHVYVGPEIRNHRDMRHYYNHARPEVQREYVKRDHKATHKVWELWKKNLLFVSDPAAELVFAKYYNAEWLKFVPPPEPMQEEQIDIDAVAALLLQAGVAVPKPKKKKRRMAPAMFYPEMADMEHELQQMISRARRMRKQ